jgi:tetratricopeptide (TPR) repeat protein
MKAKVGALLISFLRSGLLIGGTYVLLGNGGLISGASGLSFAFWSAPLYEFAALLFVSDVVRKTWENPRGRAGSILLSGLGTGVVSLGALSGLASLTEQMAAHADYGEVGRNLAPYLNHISRLGPWTLIWILGIAGYRAAEPWLPAVVAPHDPDQRVYQHGELPRTVLESGLLAGTAFLLFHPSGIFSTAAAVDLGYLQMPLYLMAGGRVLSEAIAVFGRGSWRYAAAIAVRGAAWAYLAVGLLGGVPLLLAGLARNETLARVVQQTAPYLRHVSELGPWVTAYIALTTLYSVVVLYAATQRFPAIYHRLGQAPFAPLQAARLNGVLAALIFLFLNRGGFLTSGTGLDFSFLETPAYVALGLFLLSRWLRIAALGEWTRIPAVLSSGAAWSVLAAGLFGSLPKYGDQVVPAAVPYLKHTASLGPWAAVVFLVISGYRVAEPHVAPWIAPPHRPVIRSPLKALVRMNVIGASFHLLFHPNGYLALASGLNLGSWLFPLYACLASRLAGDFSGFFGRGVWRHALQIGLRGCSWAILAFSLLWGAPSLARVMEANPHFGPLGRFLSPYVALVAPLSYWVTAAIILVAAFHASALYWNQPRYPFLHTRVGEKEAVLAQTFNRGFLYGIGAYLVFQSSGLLNIWFKVSLPYLLPTACFVVGIVFVSQLAQVIGTGRWRHGLVAVLSDKRLAKLVTQELNSLEPLDLAEFPDEVASLRGLLQSPDGAEEAEQRLGALRAALATGGAKIRRAGRFHSEALALHSQGRELMQQGRFDTAETNFNVALQRLAEAGALLDGSAPDLASDVTENIQHVEASRVECLLGRGEVKLGEGQSLLQQQRYQDAAQVLEAAAKELQLAQEGASQHRLPKEMERVQDLVRLVQAGLERCRQPLVMAVPAVPVHTPGMEADYEFLDRLGAGGQGEVWRSRRLSDGLLVAMKIPLGTRGRVLTFDQGVYNQFAREVRYWQDLRHQHVVQMFASGDTPYPWICMELMEGGDLRQRLQQGPLRLREALEVAIPLFDALAYAHLGGVYHRDLKPENVLFTKDGIPKLTDWGMAAHFHSFSGAKGIQGTLPYVAAEQLAGIGQFDRQTDLFSMGIVLYEMLTIRYPFTDDGSLPTTANLNFLDHLKDPAWMPPPPSQFQSYLPAKMDQIIVKLLAKDRRQRFTLAEQVKEDLEEIRRWL